MTERVPLFDAQRAEAWLRLRAESELRDAVSRADGPGDEDLWQIGKDCTRRVMTLAGLLAGVRAVTEQAAVGMLADLRVALGVRQLLHPSELDDELTAPVPVPGPVSLRAVPAGVTTECDIDGFRFPVRIRFSALVTDGNSARLAWRAAYTDPALTGPDAPFHGPDPLSALRSVTAVDDVGGEYFLAGGTYGGRFSNGVIFRWSGLSGLHPVPSATARWLELTLAGNAPVRIPLDQPLPRHAVTTTELDPAGAADRYVDAGALALLAGGQEPLVLLGMRPGILAMAAELLAAGVLHPGSLSLARLAAVARQRGLPLPGPLEAVPPARLPAEWVNLLDRADTQPGASGVVFPAAILPAVEGAHCVIAELASRPDISTLRVYARAWPNSELYGMPQVDPRYRWSVRDDLGGRYAVSAFTFGGGGGEANFPLRLHPPVSPLARELEITLAGRAAQASVTVPLAWQEDDWESDELDWRVEP